MTGLQIYTWQREIWVDVAPGIAKKIALRMLGPLSFALARCFYIAADVETCGQSFSTIYTNQSGLFTTLEYPSQAISHFFYIDKLLF